MPVPDTPLATGLPAGVEQPELRSAHDEQHELGELVLREVDAPQVIALEVRIRAGEHHLTQAELGLALAEQRLEALRSRVQSTPARGAVPRPEV